MKKQDAGGFVDKATQMVERLGNYLRCLAFLDLTIHSTIPTYQDKVVSSKIYHFMI